MKTLNFVLIIIYILNFCLTCSAQRGYVSPEEVLRIQKEDIKSTPYIFEGTVIKQYTKDSTIVMCSVIKVTKIYRGSPQLKLGTIRLITEQSSNMKDAYPGIGIGARYIIFSRLDNFHLFDTVITDNTFTLKSQLGYDYPVILFSNNSVNWDGNSRFKTTDSLYSFFKENGLTVQEEQK